MHFVHKWTFLQVESKFWRQFFDSVKEWAPKVIDTVLISCDEYHGGGEENMQKPVS